MSNVYVLPDSVEKNVILGTSKITLNLLQIVKLDIFAHGIYKTNC